MFDSIKLIFHSFIFYILQILPTGDAGFEDEIIEQANQPTQNGQENHANEICCKGNDLLEPNDERRATCSGGDGWLPEFSNQWKTGNRMRVVGHGILLLQTLVVIHLSLQVQA
jgi:hypothetical protein